MAFPMYLIDAFIDQPFSGNPAGVCLLPHEQPQAWMQQVALEMNQSETAFVWPQGDGTYQLRWFTPQVEVNLCGHATLAAAHGLWREAGELQSRLEFHTHSGVLAATLAGEQVQLDFPADQPKSRELPGPLAACLKAPPVWFGTGSEDLLLVLETATEVERWVPDIPAIKAVASRGLIITAPGDQGSGVDMVSRFFAPNVGINEDPVTGSAHCLLAVYWGYRLEKTLLRARQASARGGLLDLELRGDRVLLRGTAKTMLTGEFHG